MPTGSWSPGRALDTSARLPMLLQDLYRNDPMLGQALARGLDTEEMARSATGDMGRYVSWWRCQG